MVGAVRSMLTGPYEPVAQLPAGSHDGLEVASWLAPSALTVVGGGVVGVPEDGGGSVADQVMLTGPLYQPAGSGSRLACPATVGGVVSELTVSGALGSDGSEIPAALAAVRVKGEG